MTSETSGTTHSGAGSGLASYTVDATGDTSSAALVAGNLVDLPAALEALKPAEYAGLIGQPGGADWQLHPEPLELLLALKGWARAVESLAATAELGEFTRPWDEVTLRAPVERPQKIIAVGLNYQSHVADAKREVPEYPILFAKFPNTLRGAKDDVAIPRVSHRIDYEGELAVIIGRRATAVARADADACVAGYAVANDVSARDYQFRTKEMLQGKTFDGFCPLGPWISKPCSVHDLGPLALTTKVNGEQRQAATLGEMLFDVPFLIEYVTAILTLEPGDVILTGTPGGVGAGLDPRRWLRDGDVVEIEIAGLGRLENRFVAAPDE